ncbi:MAG: UDP-N-acetyl-D-mannosamine dehydrogenase [Chloroflexi bacterium HGW-Chloroflexi-6]|nr:MAG: UDP-N-acetyl-D-mannosamine dehydrogenase [Chloroflexi bacterium HGW-Chloroflexi-6]
MNFDKICILGLGYIGLPTASMFATNGIKVHGVDVDANIIETLQAGRIHIHEPGLGEIVQKAIRSGNLSVSNTPRPSDAFIIAVPTPFHNDKCADMSAVISATEAIVPHLRKGNLVVLESTSPPLTTAELVTPILEKSGLQAGEDFFVAYSPERVLPGQILRELIENDRVIGGINPESAQAGCDLYTVFVKGEIVKTTATTAEMIKLMENTYRDVNIAIANEFSRLADRFRIDIWEAISLANRHPRVKILAPGPGVGGHCISVDPWFLVEAAPDLTPLILQARKTNDTQPHFVMSLVKRAIGKDLQAKKIALLGLSYKPDVDDLRESPAVELAHLLIGEGANVKCFEPYALEGNIPGLEILPSVEAAIFDAEIIIFLVNHSQFRKISPEKIITLTKARTVLDTVNGLEHSTWEKAGFKVHRLGVNF